MWVNEELTFPEVVELDTGLDCRIRGTHFGDVNGDGLEDFICINAEGNMYVAITQGGNPPTFKPAGNGGLVREGWSWGPQERVRLGDIDGDGRLDYCVFDDKGNIYCWRNSGVGLALTKAERGYWQSFVRYTAALCYRAICELPALIPNSYSLRSLAGQLFLPRTRPRESVASTWSIPTTMANQTGSTYIMTKPQRFTSTNVDPTI